MGLIFQIKDDLFDYSSRRIGKPTALDIRNQKKITLPLIYTLNNINSSDKQFIINCYKIKVDLKQIIIGYMKLLTKMEGLSMLSKY